MKTKSQLSVLSFVVLSFWLAVNASFSSTQAQGTAFMYQGRLNTGTNPATGLFDLTFTLYNANSGGSIISPIWTNTAVPVTNGLFTVPVDFGAGVFTGGGDWLQLGVRTNGTTVAFSALSPRNQVTPTPYAIFAETANAAGLSGTIPAGDLSGTYGGAVTLNSAANSFTGNGAGLTGVNAAELGGLGVGSFWQLLGNAGTTPGVNFVGTKDETALYLDVNGSLVLELATNNSIVMANGTLGASSVDAYEVALGQAAKAVANGSVAIGWNPTSSGPGSVAIGESVVSSGNDSFASGGYSQATAGDATAMGYSTLASGTYSMALGYEAQAPYQSSFVWADSSGGAYVATGANQFLIRAQGGVGIGTTNPADPLDVFGENNWNLASSEGDFRIGNPTYRLKMGVATSGGGAGDSRIYASGGTSRIILGSNTNDVLAVSGTSVGIGTLSPGSALEVASGDVRVDGNRYLLYSGSDTNNGIGSATLVPGFGIYGGQGPCLYGYLGGELAATAPNVIALTWDASGDIWVSNNASVGTLTIRGGADLAEPFNISSGQGEVSEGAVVVIDEQNPGHLKLSDSAYDVRVAGVVSGANGINPGIQMHQQGILEGGKNVALTGRVYVQADTSNGAIHPGDLLTTSCTPGHAMKVSDHARAAGAILGKAMTGLSTGQGTVLVLVTLQ